MQTIISHRGNIEGSNPVTENNPTQVMGVIYLGYDVEIDVWDMPNGLFLGHDAPKYKIDFAFLLNKHLWIHCKNYEAVVYLSKEERFNIFYHKEDITFSSKGFLITAPGLLLSNKSIAMMPETVKEWNTNEAYGICTDYPMRYDKMK